MGPIAATVSSVSWCPPLSGGAVAMVAATVSGWTVAQSATYRPISAPSATTAAPTASSFFVNTLKPPSPASGCSRDLEIPPAAPAYLHVNSIYRYERTL